VLAAPSTATAGNAFSVTVTVLDAFGNTAAGYTGTVHFSSDDAAAALPANSRLTGGTGTFSVNLHSAGSHALTIADSTTAALTDTANLSVAALAATHFVVSAPANAIAGNVVTFTVMALDSFNNVATGYSGTVHFSATDGTATLPAATQLTAGVGTFTATLRTAGSQLLTSSDAALPASTGSATIQVSPALATHFSVSAPASATAGATSAFTVSALDAFGNLATGYAGTVHFTSSDTGAALPGDATLSAGFGSFSASLTTAGSETLTAADTTTPSIAGTAALTVSAAAVSRLTLSAPASAGAGSAFTFTVTARDAFGNVATGYTGTVHFASSDATALLPANVTLAHGTGSFRATLLHAGGESLIATDTSTASVAGSASIQVNAAATTHFAVAAPATATAGASFSFTVTALDAYGNTAVGYTGTVHFTSADPGASLPAATTLTNGFGSFSATLQRAGGMILTAADASIVGSSGTASIAVSPAAATHLTVVGPAAAIAGTSLTFTVTALDSFGNTATGYAGKVHFASTDAAATLPADAVLTGGAGSFSVTFRTAAGTQALTVTDTTTAPLTGTAQLPVSALAATHFLVSAPTKSPAGAPFNFTVTALDIFGNVATGYAGTVHFSSTDPAGTVPANATLTSGAGSFTATLKSAGTINLAVADTATVSIAGSSAVQVTPLAATQFQLAAAASTVAGQPLSLTLTALDAFGNVAVGYTGTVHFTSSDSAAALPGNASLVNGVGVFTATLDSAGARSIHATDLANALLSGAAQVQVNAAAASQLTLSGPGSAVAGQASTVTVTALDAFGNVATSYAGQLHFSSNDPAAVLPANGSLTAGTGTFSAILVTEAATTLTVSDTAAAGLKASATISVGAAAASRLVLSAPQNAGAGGAVTVTVTALDSFGNTATGFSDLIHFTSSDAAATLPADGTLTNGIGTFSTTFATAQQTTLTVTDIAATTLTASASVLVNPAAATRLALSASPSATAGANVTFTVTALDAFGNTATSFADVIHFASTDGAASLPVDVSLSGGVGTFVAALRTAGSQKLLVTDTTVTALQDSAAIQVSAAAPNTFSLATPAGAAAGTAVTETLTALDAFGNIASAYNGTVHVSSSDPHAVLPGDFVVAAGTASFNATLETAGAQTLSVADTSSASLSAGATLSVSPAAAASFALNAPSTEVAGVPVTFTLTALDPFGNVATGYAGTVQFASSDHSATLPAPSTLSAGIGTFSATLDKTGLETLSASDAANSLQANASVQVGPAAAASISLGAPATTTAGTSVTVTVTVHDALGNVDTGYTGTLHFTSTDPAAVLPANLALTGGTGSFSANLHTAGTQTLTVADTRTGTLSATTSGIQVSPALATHFSVTAPAAATAGSPLNFTVTARDAFGNTATGYQGTVQFTSSDPAAVLPAPVSLAGGVGTFSATLATATNQTLTATDGATASLTGAASVQVAPAAAAAFVISTPASTAAGSTLTFTITARDAFGNLATAYAGSIEFASSDAGALLPASATLTAGVGQFTATLKKAGPATITATDTVSAALTITSSAIQVTPLAATHLVLTDPPSATAGNALPVTVTAEDAFGNTATSYHGTVTVTSTDSAAVVPATLTLVAGSGSFDATLQTAGTQSLAFADPAVPALSASLNVAVAAAPATHFAIAAPATTSAGGPVNFTVSAFDAFNNLASSYAGTVHFSSTDPHAVLPGNLTLTAGTGTFSTVLDQAGTQSLTVADTQVTTIATTTTIQVAPAPVAQFVVVTPSTSTAGDIVPLTVTAHDGFGNLATNYTGMVHFTSSAGGAQLPADTRLVGGQGNFNAILDQATLDTLTVNDTQAPSVTGASSVQVGPGAATHFLVTTPANAMAGSQVTVTVSALDAFGNVATGYTGTVHFTSSTPGASLPADATLSNGVGTFRATLDAANSQSISVADTSNSSIGGGTGSVQVTPAPATQFLVSGPVSAAAGSTAAFTVTAEDAFGNAVPGYSGTLHLTSTDPTATLPGQVSVAGGSGGFSAVFTHAGTETLTAAAGSLAGTSGPVNVTALAATHFAVNADPSGSAGSAVNFTVAALDTYNNLAGSYAGSVRFTSSDPAAILPTPASLTGGLGHFSATFRTSGNDTVTAVDAAFAALAGSSNPVAVQPAAANHFLLSTPASAIAGVPFTYTVEAADIFGNLVPSYNGTVHFSAAGATLPPDSPLTHGAGTFSASFRSGGNQVLSATDSAGLTGSSAAFTVAPGAVARFTINTPAGAAAGTPFAVTVTAYDAYNNVATGYTGTVRFTSTDPGAALPAVATLTGGVGSFSVTLKSVASQTLTATDNTGTGLAITSAAINVTPGAVAQLLIASANTAAAGSSLTVTVTALDAFGNVATNYNGTVSFFSTDPTAILPSSSTLTPSLSALSSGVGTFSVVFQTPGTQTLTVAANSGVGVQATTGPIAVSGTAAPAPVPSTPAPVPTSSSPAPTVPPTPIALVSHVTLPHVVSILRVGGAVRTGPTLTFRVTFNESVRGVSIHAFSLRVRGAIVGARITRVRGLTSRSFLVTIATGHGVGTLRLDLRANSGINDLAGHVLRGSYTRGQSYIKPL
jgi:S-adenosylmethionine hydrolase